PRGTDGTGRPLRRTVRTPGRRLPLIPPTRPTQRANAPAGGFRSGFSRDHAAVHPCHCTRPTTLHPGAAPDHATPSQRQLPLRIFRRTVVQPPVDDPRRSRPWILARIVWTHQVDHRPAACLGVVGNQAAVAAPPHGLGAHHRGRQPAGEREQPFTGGPVGRRVHVVGIAAEAGIAPGGVRRVRARLAPSAQLRHRHELDSSPGQALRQGLAPELRMPPRARVAAHVAHAGHLRRAQHPHEHVQRAGGMTNGPEPVHARILPPGMWTGCPMPILARQPPAPARYNSGLTPRCPPPCPPPSAPRRCWTSVTGPTATSASPPPATTASASTTASS